VAVVKRGAATASGHPVEEARAQVAEGVRRVIALSTLYNDQVSARVGMSASESQSIHLLQLHGPMTAGRLAEVTGLSTGTITGVLDRLEALGFVKRERSTQDRRKVVVTLDEGRIWAVMAPYYAHHGANLDEALSHYGPDELRILREFLDRLAPPGAPPAPLPWDGPDALPGT
jgi:DNA-binding MarR family transcriptional regulator